MAACKMTHHAAEVTFEWHGGPYIDVCLGSRAFDVINVWDYVNDAPDLTMGDRPAFRALCRQWMTDYAEDYRRNGYGLW